MLKKVQKGFTLIELMIVVAIIGILAAIAIPAYQDYVIRSQVSEGLAMASATKASVAEYFADRGEWPATEADLGITTPPVGKYVTGIRVNSGIITITYGAQANGAIRDQTLALTPFATQNLDIVWQCGSRDISGDVSFSTAIAPSTVPTDGGSIAGKYRPSNCRGVAP